MRINSILNLVDNISNELMGTDLSQGNAIQSMIGIAQKVAQNMQGELENDPEKIQNTIGAITDVFKEAMDDSTKNGEEIPAELKNMFNTILASPLTEGADMSEDEITKHLENIINANGLDRNEFFDSIKASDGGIDVNKLETDVRWVGSYGIG